METKGAVYYNEILAGYLSKINDEYIFEYEDKYFADEAMPAISLAFAKKNKVFTSKILFPFFYGLLAEGDQKQIQCRKLRIDENDNFTRLIKTAANTIGAVAIREVK